MRQLLWTQLATLSAVFVALSFWGLARFTLATSGRYAKPKGVSLALGLAWFALLIGAIYTYPGLGLFASTMTVTLFADNYYKAGVARFFGSAEFHFRMTEVLRGTGVGRFLWIALPSPLLQLAVALALLGLSAGTRDWFYWALLGFASAHFMTLVSTIASLSSTGRLNPVFAASPREPTG
jgi:hypothetical protein